MKRKVLASLLVLSLAATTGCSKDANHNSDTMTEATPQVTEEAVVSTEPEQELMVKNGDFSQPNENPETWSTYTNGGGASFAIQDEQGVLTISTTGSVNYGVQLYQDIVALTQGCVYRLSFDISASAERSIEYRVQLNGGDYHAYAGNENYKVTTEMKTETLEFKFEEESDPAPRLVFNCGKFDDTEGLGEHQIFIDNVSLEMIDDSDMIVVEAQEAKTLDVNINQIGYLPNQKKVAIFRGENKGTSFEVVNADTNETIFTGNVENETANRTADETNYYGDFTEVTTPGTYFIKTSDYGESYTFTIGEDIYDNCYSDSVKMLYRQRCGCATDSTIAGNFAHPECHITEATIYGTDEKIDVSGGWHDAGDYGRYVVAGAKTVMDLFLSVEQGGDAESDTLGIPESNNSVPDLLDEARYELEWMLKMQDTKTGGVYHKVTCANFPGDDVLPENETEELIVSPISTTATYDFAAVMAKASTLYEAYDKTFAKTCKEAAQKAMDYAEETGSDGGFKNPEGISTGEYPDTSTRDERYWACAELYKITSNSEYLETMEAIVSNDMPSGFGWQSVGDYGTYTFLTTEGVEQQALYQTLREYFIKQADRLVACSQLDGYKISLENEYPWGSNLNVANNAMFLILANTIEANTTYIDTAYDHLHYCLGANPMSISYVTGYGSLSPVNAHHRPSYALGESMPGMLVGGPDKALEDPYARAVLEGEAPAKCYVDNHASYSTNEVTIYWNSPFIFDLAVLK